MKLALKSIKIKMPVERSAGIIIFVNNTSGRKYLVIRSSRTDSQISPKKSVKEFWDFPKGRLNNKESGLEAAKREADEEVGMGQLEIIPGFKETARYFTRREGKPIPKFVAMFLAEARDDKVKLSWEHDKYEWLPYEEAYERISLLPMKQALERADKFLIP